MTLIEGFDDGPLTPRFETIFLSVVVGLMLLAIITDGCLYVVARNLRREGFTYYILCFAVVAICFAQLVLPWIGVTHLMAIPGASAKQYCMELRSPTNYAENCPDTGLVQDYFGMGKDRSGNDVSQWIGITGVLVAMIMATFGVFGVCLLSSGGLDDDDVPAAGILLMTLVAGVAFWVCTMIFAAQAVDVYRKTWPKNGCYLAICTRHGTSGFGTAKTSLSPVELRDLWQGGIGYTYAAIALGVGLILFTVVVVLHEAVRPCVLDALRGMARPRPRPARPAVVLGGTVPDQVARYPAKEDPPSPVPAVEPPSYDLTIADLDEFVVGEDGDAEAVHGTRAARRSMSYV